jgi:hypothetical protein
MTIGRQSVQRSWFALLAVVGSMSATVTAGTADAQDRNRSTVAEGTRGACAATPAIGTLIRDPARLATANRVPGSESVQASPKADASARVSRSPASASAMSTTCHRMHESGKVRSGTGLRNKSHSRVRIPGSHGCSIDCCADLPREHDLLIVPEEVNDDTTSGEPTDDDDGWDDLSADDDWHAPIIVCFREAAHYLSARESAAPVSWIVHTSSPFLASQRLRC